MTIAPKTLTHSARFWINHCLFAREMRQPSRLAFVRAAARRRSNTTLRKGHARSTVGGVQACDGHGRGPRTGGRKNRRGPSFELAVVGE
jgi:hypothetical protein